MGTFADFGPRLTAPPPVHCIDTILYFFLLEANKQILARLCAQVFKKNKSIICRPIDKYLLLVFGNIKRVGNPAVKASVSELQVLIQVPVYYKIDKVYGCGYFTPYIWVDNPLSMAGGREVYGYPKGMGDLIVPRNPVGAALDLSLLTWVGDINQGEVWSKDEQITVAQGGAFQPPLADNMIVDFWLQQLESDQSRLLLKHRLQGTWTEIFLKQFRAITGDVSNQTTCFEQIATAEYSIDQGSRIIGEFKSKFDLQIANFDSADVVTSLRLANFSAVPNKKQIFHTTLKGCLQVEIPSLYLTKGRVLWSQSAIATGAPGNLAKAAARSTGPGRRKRA